jgi:hypothetical protein
MLSCQSMCLPFRRAVSSFRLCCTQTAGFCLNWIRTGGLNCWVSQSCLVTPPWSASICHWIEMLSLCAVNVLLLVRWSGRQESAPGSVQIAGADRWGFLGKVLLLFGRVGLDSSEWKRLLILLPPWMKTLAWFLPKFQLETIKHRISSKLSYLKKSSKKN